MEWFSLYFEQEREKIKYIFTLKYKAYRDIV